MNNPDHISKSLETIFGVKIFKFFDADPGSGMGKIRIRDEHLRSATLAPANQVFRLRIDSHSVRIRFRSRHP
jgi:hypothetical protein